jgi:hypothetical protein
MTSHGSLGRADVRRSRYTGSGRHRARTTRMTPFGHRAISSERRFPERHALRKQLLEQGAGRLQIRGRETFGELIVHRCEQRSRLAAPALAHPQTSNAEGNPQLPK